MSLFGFKYSPRPHTPALRLGDDVPGDEERAPRAPLRGRRSAWARRTSRRSSARASGSSSRGRARARRATCRATASRGAPSSNGIVHIEAPGAAASRRRGRRGRDRARATTTRWPGVPTCPCRHLDRPARAAPTTRRRLAASSDANDGPLRAHAASRPRSDATSSSPATPRHRRRTPRRRGQRLVRRRPPRRLLPDPHRRADERAGQRRRPHHDDARRQRRPRSATTSPSATRPFSTACTVGDRCLVGMGSIVLDGAVVGDESSSPPARSSRRGRSSRRVASSWAARPRCVRSVTDAEAASIRESAAKYVEFARDFASSCSRLG